MNSIEKQLLTFFVFLFLISPPLISINSSSEQINDDESLWTSFPGSFRLTPSFPDENSRYDVFSFLQHSGDYDYLRITGKYPFARYFSFTLYDDDTSTDIAALYDSQIIPDNGSFNPFQMNISRSVIKRNYTIWLVKEGVNPQKGIDNVLIIPKNKEKIGLFYRLYRPDKGADLKGNVPLPVINAFKEDMKPGILPESSLTPFSLFSKIKTLMFNQDLILTWALTRQFSNDTIRFYRINDSGLYPSSDNEYIVASLTPNYQNKIAVIRFTPPSFEDTFLGDDFTGGRQVRYWSLSIGGLGMTSTPDSLCDDQVVLDADGSAKLVIAPRLLDGLLESFGYSVLHWGVCYKPILIYRQMLANPEFTGNIKLVPMIDRPPSSADRNMQYFMDHNASRFIGSYCPEVEMYSISSFLLNELN